MLWRLGYYSQQPRIFHVPNLRMYGLMVGRWMGQAFDKYKPDLVVSVHPLLQHIPIRILEARVRLVNSCFGLLGDVYRTQVSSV